MRLFSNDYGGVSDAGYQLPRIPIEKVPQRFHRQIVAYDTNEKPAPQTSYDEARPDERLFGRLETTLDEEAVNTRLERERKFDPDIWVVEVEPGSVPIEELIAIRTS